MIPENNPGGNAINITPADIYVPEPVDENKTPQNIKLDLTTDLESFLSTCGCMVTILGFLFLVWGKSGCKSKHGEVIFDPIPILYTLAPYVFIIAAGMFVSWLFTNNYYILSVPRRMIFYHYRFYLKEFVTPFLKPEDIAVVTLDGKECHSKSSKWWEYKIVAVTNKGETIDLSDFKNESVFIEQLNKAKAIAAILRCGYAEYIEKTNLVVKKEGRQISVFLSRD